MVPESETNLRLKIGHVLFIDLVGYSKLLIEEQKERQRQLTDILLATAQVAAATNEELVRLPTGDGMALVFWNSAEEPAQCALEATRALKEHPAIEVRMGIHSGPVSEVIDVNGRINIAGAGINMAQRVMDCGDAGHILLSKHVADDLENYGRWQPLLRDLGEVEVKHGVRLHLVNLCGDGFGHPETPAKLKQTDRALVAGTRRKRKWQFIGAAVALWLYFRQPTRPPEKSIAVLPLENLSDKKSDANFVDGVHDEILTDLAKVADLKVISGTSTKPYRAGTERNIREIGKALGAAHVVEGSVQRDGQRVRVNVQLIDARTDTHLWAESYDRDVADTFALESELAETIVARLKAKLSPAEKAAIEEESTSDPLAHDLYLEANALITAPLFNVQGTQNLFEAADLLEKAVARDPNYFLAYCKLASVHDQIYLNGPDHTPARLALASSAVEAAQRLRPDAGETHLALAEHLYCGYLDYDRARRELKLAHRSLPNEPLVFELAGFMDRRQGRWDASTRNLLRALELDPRNTYTLQQIAVSYQLLRRFDEAAAMIDRALAVLPNDPGLQVARAALDLYARADPRAMHKTIQKIVAKDPDAASGIADEWFYLALCERDPVAAGKTIAAMKPEGYSNEGVLFPRAWCEGLVARMLGDSTAERAAFAAARNRVEENLRDEPAHAEALCVLGMIDAALGRKDDAIREGRRAVELLPLEKDSINGPLAIEYLAVIYAWTGEIDMSIEQLRAAAAIPGEISYGQLRLHPFWDSLRGDPRFEKIVASLAPVAENP
jgi:TolB-like protein/Flp pilus assembly protein TadD